MERMQPIVFRFETTVSRHVVTRIELQAFSIGKILAMGGEHAYGERTDYCAQFLFPRDSTLIVMCKKDPHGMKLKLWTMATMVEEVGFAQDNSLVLRHPFDPIRQART